MLGRGASDALPFDFGRHFRKRACKEELDGLSLAALPAGLHCFDADPLGGTASTRYCGCVLPADRPRPGDPYGTRCTLADVEGISSGVYESWLLGPVSVLNSRPAARRIQSKTVAYGDRKPDAIANGDAVHL